MFCLFYCIVLAVFYELTFSHEYPYLDLPPEQLSVYFNAFAKIKDKCLNDISCPHRQFLLSSEYNKDICWGYETWCKSRFLETECNGSAGNWVKNKKEQIEAFFHQADFGYVKQQINELSVMCEASFHFDSSLECSKFLRFCRGRNLMFDFTHLTNQDKPIRYNTDVLKPGGIKGFCTFYRERLLNETEHLGALQSWAPELRNFEELVMGTSQHQCDITIEKPTFIMKIDATFNMYHHFCDFFNLYASLHVNCTHPFNFNTDNHVLIWETYKYESPFAETFRAFTYNPIWNLNTFSGKTVCFRNVVLPLLPRMIFGLYYNTPIINGCRKSKLFRAFSEFVLHRLKIPVIRRNTKKLRITFLVRQTKYRRILNEDQLVNEINKEEQYLVTKISFGRAISFTEQLKIIRNTDVLIGIHGAGLTHLLFLPNWASVFELYNCGDPNCYKDLARLRGVYYLTWEDQSKLYPEESSEARGGAHAKFTNYAFDKYEFRRLVNNAVEHVLNHKEFSDFIQTDFAIFNDEL